VRGRKKGKLGLLYQARVKLVTTEDLLSPKAVEVLQLLADGLSVAEAADHLGNTENAARNRLSEARKKTGVPNNNGLIGNARRRSLVQ
jgi:DNA-binding NarL/FixJ family response regulator